MADSQIAPDTKDWTWVLDRPCPECGFDSAAVDRSGLADATRHSIGAWERVLERDDVTVRPTPSTWSPLEYACHVRDVYSLFGQRIVLMLTQDDPQFENWDQDVTAVQARYGEQDPHRVALDLAAAGASLASIFETVADDAWGRPGRRSNGSRFTVDSIGRYFLHDVVHHLHDVGVD
jgi:hypothetical protein